LSLRYSIYKVQIRSLLQARLGSLRTFICYHIFNHLSRTFFKFFQISFRCALCSRISAFITQLFKFTTFFSVCQELFHFFSNFFSCGVALCRTQLFKDNTLTSYCQELFLVFLKFFVYRRRSRGQLAYISTSNPICQALFYKFRTFFLAIFTHAQLSTLGGFSISAAGQMTADTCQGIPRIYSRALSCRKVP